MFFVYCKKHSAHCEPMIRECVNCGRLQEVKTNGKSLTVRHRKKSRSLTGCGRLLEVSAVGLSLGKFYCFGLAVVYGK